MITTPKLPIKDVLRGLRFGLKSGREMLRPLQQDLPGPLRQVAQQLDVAVDSFASDIDTASSNLARRILDQDSVDGARMLSLMDLIRHRHGELLFGQWVYHGLTRAFEVFECAPPLISEVVAVRAFEDVRATVGQATAPPELAADLIVALRDLNAVRMTKAGSELIPVAHHAVFLWFLLDRQPGEDEDALLRISCELAHALRKQIIEIDGDRGKTIEFLGNYARCI